MSSKKSGKTGVETRNSMFDARSRLNEWLEAALNELRDANLLGSLDTDLLDHPEIKIRAAYRSAIWCFGATRAIDENDVANLAQYVIYATEAHKDRRLVQGLQMAVPTDLAESWRDWAHDYLDEEGLANVEHSDLFENTTRLVRLAAYLRYSTEYALEHMRDNYPLGAVYSLLRACRCVGRINVYLEEQKLNIASDRVARQQKGFLEHNEKIKQESEALSGKARELRSQDWTIAAIAAEVGRSEKQVGRYLKNKK